mgnify:CR=1 FL=1
MGLLKSSSHSDIQFDKLKKTGFQFNYKQIIKRTIVQPKTFSGYFDFECPEEIEDESIEQSNDIFRVPEQTKLCANMSSIIVLENNNMQQNEILMHENNIFFNRNDTTTPYEGTYEKDHDDSLMEYVTADDHTPVATKGTLVDLSKCILREDSPLNRKQKVIVDDIVPFLIEPQDIDANSTLTNNQDIKNSHIDPTIHIQLRDIQGKYLDSTDSFADLSQSTILKEGICSDISSQESTTSNNNIPCSETSNSYNFVWPMGEGPCRRCHGDVSNHDNNGKKVNKSFRSIFATELHGQWHRGCFKCKDCSSTLDQKNECYVYDDEPYCRYHYHVHNNSLCKICENVIEGECLQNHKEERFHSNCMKCYVCNEVVQTDYTLINETVPICKEHDLDTLVKQGIIEL